MFSKIRIRLDAELLRRASHHARALGFVRVEDYIEHLLERQLPADQAPASKEALLEKLKGLGYLH